MSEEHKHKFKLGDLVKLSFEMTAPANSKFRSGIVIKILDGRIEPMVDVLWNCGEIFDEAEYSLRLYGDE